LSHRQRSNPAGEGNETLYFAAGIIAAAFFF
jgi:hypothetical protein